MEKKDKQPHKVNWLKVMLAVLLAVLAFEAVLIFSGDKTTDDPAPKKVAAIQETASSVAAVDDNALTSIVDEMISSEVEDESQVRASEKASGGQNSPRAAKPEGKKQEKVKSPVDPIVITPQDNQMTDDNEKIVQEPVDNVTRRDDNVPEATKANRPFEPRGPLRKYEPNY